ncbi:MAG: DUF559 domain-containing protein [Thermoflexales bacterium]|nr:DUF559 domain-containing protein [Thermoflexales bacterium]
MSHDKSHRIHPVIRQRSRELRQPQTPAESKLWTVLRGRQFSGYKFRRQHPIGRFIVDFYCAEARLVIEIDGDSHAEQVEYDATRTDWLAQHGYRVIRFVNRDVLHQLEAVTEQIMVVCKQSPQMEPPA